jgi:hypothetical protein
MPVQPPVGSTRRRGSTVNGSLREVRVLSYASANAQNCLRRAEGSNRDGVVSIPGSDLGLAEPRRSAQPPHRHPSGRARRCPKARGACLEILDAAPTLRSPGPAPCRRLNWRSSRPSTAAHIRDTAEARHELCRLGRHSTTGARGSSPLRRANPPLGAASRSASRILVALASAPRAFAGTRCPRSWAQAGR